VACSCSLVWARSTDSWLTEPLLQQQQQFPWWEEAQLEQLEQQLCLCQELQPLESTRTLPDLQQQREARAC